MIAKKYKEAKRSYQSAARNGDFKAQCFLGPLIHFFFFGLIELRRNVFGWDWSDCGSSPRQETD